MYVSELFREPERTVHLQAPAVSAPGPAPFTPKLWISPPPCALATTTWIIPDPAGGKAGLANAVLTVPDPSLHALQPVAAASARPPPLNDVVGPDDPATRKSPFVTRLGAPSSRPSTHSWLSSNTPLEGSGGRSKVRWSR